MAERDGAPWRRKQRQLWAWHRHERMTVRMELATALHHNAHRPKTGKVVEEPEVEEYNPIPGLKSWFPRPGSGGVLLKVVLVGKIKKHTGTFFAGTPALMSRWSASPWKLAWFSVGFLFGLQCCGIYRCE